MKNDDFKFNKDKNIPSSYKVKDDSFMSRRLKKIFKRELALTIVSIVGVTLVMLGGSYSVFSEIIKAEDANVIRTGTLAINFNDTEEGLGNIISLNGEYPTSDGNGQLKNPYTFKITNNGSIKAAYKIYVLDDTDMINEDGCQQDLLNHEVIKYSLDKSSPKTLSTASDGVIETGTLAGGASKTYDLRMWIGDNAGNDDLGKHYHGKIVVEAEQGSRVKSNTEQFIEKKANPDTVTNYNDATEDQKKEMFKITHPDGTTSYRYIGESPNNYVTFNDEKAGWRIIGVTNEENASGTKEWRIKLIRADRLNDANYSWDNTYTSSNQNVNDWENAALNKLLNSGIYWTRGSGTCPYGQNNATTSCSFTSNGLTSTAKGQIENMKWNLGATTWANTNTTESYYTAERGSTKGGAGGALSTNGNVGLPYPSDFGYTYAKGVSDGCYNTPSNSDSSSCGSTNAGKGWMFSTSYSFWTITPRSDNSLSVFAVGTSGFVHVPSAYDDTYYGVRPVVYLQSNIQLSGEGTVNSPYTITG